MEMLTQCSPGAPPEFFIHSVHSFTPTRLISSSALFFLFVVGWCLTVHPSPSYALALVPLYSSSGPHITLWHLAACPLPNLVCHTEKKIAKNSQSYFSRKFQSVLGDVGISQFSKRTPALLGRPLAAPLDLHWWNAGTSVLRPSFFKATQKFKQCFDKVDTWSSSLCLRSSSSQSTGPAPSLEKRTAVRSAFGSYASFRATIFRNRKYPSQFFSVVLSLQPVEPPEEPSRTCISEALVHHTGLHHALKQLRCITTIYNIQASLLVLKIELLLFRCLFVSRPYLAKTHLSLNAPPLREATSSDEVIKKRQPFFACLLGPTKKRSFSARSNRASKRIDCGTGPKEKNSFFSSTLQCMSPFSEKCAVSSFTTTTTKGSPWPVCLSLAALYVAPKEVPSVHERQNSTVSSPDALLTYRKAKENPLQLLAYKSAAFVLLDLIKIFGRLAEPSHVGSVIASPVSSPARVASDVLSVYDRLLRPVHPRAGRTSPSAQAEAVTAPATADTCIRNKALVRTSAISASKTASGAVSVPITVSAAAEEQRRVAAVVEAWLKREKARWRHSTYESLLEQRTKNAFMRKGGSSRRRKWERLFFVSGQQQQQQILKDTGKEVVRDRLLGTGLTRQAFEAQLLQLPFAWPLLPNAGALPATIPYQPAAFEEFLAVCSAARETATTHVKTAKKLEGGRSRIPHYERVNALVQRTSIHSEAIDCVWRALTTLFHGPFGEVLSAADRTAETRLLPPALLRYQRSISKKRYLYRGDLLRCIWQWAPADGFVDWNTFTFFLDEIPADGIDNMVD